MQTEALRQFQSSWKFVRSLTVEFVDTTPAEHWMTSPHSDYAPLAKQVRHLVWVSGLYNDALQNRKINLKNKKTCYAGTLERGELRAALQAQDEILWAILSPLNEAEANRYSMDFFGGNSGLYEFLNNMIQHESMHHGMWALYAKLAGFPCPRTWKSTWEL
jgi:uncharacterized damage-inducible protein DinB